MHEEVVINIYRMKTEKHLFPNLCNNYVIILLLIVVEFIVFVLVFCLNAISCELFVRHLHGSESSGPAVVQAERQNQGQKR